LLYSGKSHCTTCNRPPVESIVITGHSMKAGSNVYQILTDEELLSNQVVFVTTYHDLDSIDNLIY
jgi:hypothetical protein